MCLTDIFHIPISKSVMWPQAYSVLCVQSLLLIGCYGAIVQCGFIAISDINGDIYLHMDYNWGCVTLPIHEGNKCRAQKHVCT